MESYTAETACPNATTLAPAGWTFVPQHDNNSTYNIICHTHPASTPTNWPTEQIDACSAMLGCLAVSYTLEDDGYGHPTPVFCYTTSGDNLISVANDTNSTMPRTCMGTMVKNGERIGDWGGWRWLWLMIEHSCTVINAICCYNPSGRLGILPRGPHLLLH